ncbi:MAG: PLP-dependent aspartate aminotransferase family protein [Gammaproteobacteria bacterium]|nr:PLP-dependent aspartate aminotransferase family protein [Gammaproteobacteria bacterium]MCY4219516.1 PLP-dependent aspartate aminotransferase family protein [Gammaproteobacteria bacterium]MCY4273910.1 PLP-dependent aspartate aminotransferase family protein [Gammaproteobacteria bacterium]
MSNKTEPRFQTREVHGGVEPDPTTGAILTPIYQTTTYVQESVDQYMDKGYSYSRSGNPTVVALEEKITSLENGAGSACFATGMAATSATMMALLNHGDHCILSDVVYGGTHRLATYVLSRFGVNFSFIDTSNPVNVERALRPETRLIFTETPANPTLKLTDIAAISTISKEKGIPHVVDNTFLTPYFQRPLELGADISLHSTTKFMEGHNISVGGSITANTKEMLESIKFVRNCLGSNMSPMVAFYTLQGCKTLSTRIRAQSENAARIADFLTTHNAVDRVCYPGLDSFPQKELANRQASGYGSMLWFEVKGGVEAGKQLMNTLKLWSLAENLGSVESLVTHSVTMTHADIPREERMSVGITDGLVRLSTGLEAAEDLISDLKQALDRL